MKINTKILFLVIISLAVIYLIASYISKNSARTKASGCEQDKICATDDVCGGVELGRCEGYKCRCNDNGNNAPNGDPNGAMFPTLPTSPRPPNTATSTPIPGGGGGKKGAPRISPTRPPEKCETTPGNNCGSQKVPPTATPAGGGGGGGGCGPGTDRPC